MIRKYSAALTDVNGGARRMGRDALVASVEAAYADGALEPGGRLPAIRALADALGVSPGTVQQAYRVLGERGLTEADGRRGTRLRPSSAYRTPLRARVPEGARDLMLGNPDLRLLPKLPRLAHPQRLYDAPVNDPRLVALAASRFAADGIPHAHLAILSGALDAMDRVLDIRTRPGDTVLVEDPAFSSVLDLCALRGLKPVPVALDDEGILPASLAEGLRHDPRALIITPRAQNPTGAALTPARRDALREVLDAQPGLLIVEDDHAGEVAGAPAMTLTDGWTGPFLVVRSVSKALGPDLRLAFASLDHETYRRLTAQQRVGFRWVSGILQRTVVALLEDCDTDAALERAAEAYGKRRSALVRALRARGVAAHGRSGLNVWVPVPEETAVVMALASRGWAVSAGERFRVQSGPGVRITTSTLPVSLAPKVADDLADILAGG